jgi:hypothetical protein
MSNPGYCPTCKESGWACRCGREPFPLDSGKAIMETKTTTPTDGLADFVPCPMCKQYSHSIAGDDLADAIMHFESMTAHPLRGTPMGHNFDEQTRDYAQMLVAAARAALASSAGSDDLVRARDHIAEQITFAETRIQDGIELGATVWRLALEDIVRENKVTLESMGRV